MSSGPGRTRRSEPRWGEASGDCRAVRLPVGRRRDESEGPKPPRTPLHTGCTYGAKPSTHISLFIDHQQFASLTVC